MPCVLRPDLALDGDDATADGDRAAQAGHVGAMLAENLHRGGLSAVEEARGVQAMLNLGVSLTRVAESTGLGRKRVAKAAGVARLDGDTAAAVAGAGLTLDQAAVAVYADDSDTTAALLAAAGEGPGQFTHALTRAKQAKQEAEQAAALLAELAAAGRTVLDEDTGTRTRLADLEHDGQPLTADGHAGCPASAVYISISGWQGSRAVEVLHRPGRQRPPRPMGGHRPARRRSGRGTQRRRTRGRRGRAAGHHREQQGHCGGERDPAGVDQGPAAAQDRAQGRAAVRRRNHGHRPPGTSRWLSGQPNRGQDSAAADLGIDAPGQWWTTRDKPSLTFTNGEKVPDARLAVALLAHVAGAIESGLHRQSGRNPRRRRRPLAAIPGLLRLHGGRDRATVHRRRRRRTVGTAREVNSDA